MGWLDSRKLYGTLSFNPVEAVSECRNGVVGAFNSFDKYDARNSHYVGFLSRSNNRLRAPGLYLSQDSMLIALNDLGRKKVIGVVEVCLEAPDGKLAPAVAMRVPWRAMKDYHEPYLCNLCVDSDYRRQGLGLVLCQLAERIVVKYWLKKVMYLHVEVNNIAAQNLYSKMGYELGPQLPSWERRLHGELVFIDWLIFDNRSNHVHRS